MSLKERLVWAGVSALLGAFLVATASRAFRSSKLSTTPERIIPAQELRLQDQHGAIIAFLHISTKGSLNLDLTTASGDLLASTGLGPSGNGQTFTTVYGPMGASVTANVIGHSLWIDVSSPDGKSKQFWNAWPRSGPRSGLIWALGEWAYHQVVPAEPDTLDSLIPTQDLRLTDKAGHSLAVLGLTEAGEPTIAFVDDSGRIVACWMLFEGPVEGWLSSIQTYDTLGHIRFAVVVAPGRTPRLTIFEEPNNQKDDPGIYELDPETYDDVPAKHPWSEYDTSSSAREIPWLRHANAEPITAPIVLLDQRSSVVWKAP